VATLKFQAELASLPDCPPSTASAHASVGFHWVFDPLTDQRNFVVKAVKTPARFAVKPRCDAHALSMWDTEQRARDEYDRIRQKNQNIANELGTHVAEMTLTPNHGLQTAPNLRGHFSLYEYIGVSLSAAATLKGPL